MLWVELCPPKKDVETLISSVPHNVTLFKTRVIAELISSNEDILE